MVRLARAFAILNLLFAILEMFSPAPISAHAQSPGRDDGETGEGVYAGRVRRSWRCGRASRARCSRAAAAAAVSSASPPALADAPGAYGPATRRCALDPPRPCRRCGLGEPEPDCTVGSAVFRPGLRGFGRRDRAHVVGRGRHCLPLPPTGALDCRRPQRALRSRRDAQLPARLNAAGAVMGAGPCRQGWSTRGAWAPRAAPASASLGLELMFAVVGGSGCIAAVAGAARATSLASE